MKFFLFITSFIFINTITAQTVISGKIKNKITGEPLIGATVYFPELKSGTTTTIDGSYFINNLPAINTLIEIKFIGYATIVKTVDLSTVTKLDVDMEESVIESDEIVVTGTSKASEIKRNPAPISFINQKFLQQNSFTNVIDALVKVPGLNAMSTGPNVSKPFIRGLGYNRILTLYDGIRQEGQQWGDEHGVEIDQFLIDRIEVIKGPSSLIYGSDALGGVINLLPENPLPISQNKVNVHSEYSTNNQQRSTSAAYAGNNNGYILNVRGTYKDAIDFKNKYDGRVYNTGFREKDATISTGLNRKWGYSYLSISAYNNMQEIPDGSRDSTTRKFTKQITEADSVRPIASTNELNSYSISPIHQEIQHYRIFSASNFIFGKNKLTLKLSYQNNVRKEFSHPQNSDIAGLQLKLNTYTYDIKYHLPEKQDWEGIIGINGMYQLNNINNATEFIIPQYTLFDFAPFLFIKKKYGRFDFAAGIRYDTRFFKNEELYITTDSKTGFYTKAIDTGNAIKQFDYYNNVFNGFSGSYGLACKLSESFTFKTNLSNGYRAPNASEISAKGVHPGTGYKQTGDNNLKPEQSFQEDFGLFYDSKHISANIELYNNVITNYIYNQKLKSVSGTDSVYLETGNTYPVFKFFQTKAQLSGGEAKIDVHPHPFDWLHFENSISFINAINLGGNGVVINSNNKYLPFIPPLHTCSELRAEFKNNLLFFSQLFVKIGVQYYAAQKKVLLENNTETPTPSYTLVDAGIGSNIINKKQKTIFTFGIYATNLFDVAYQSNMSRLKYFEQYPQNNTGRFGIYNMGRNINFKITIPIELKNYY